MSFARYFLVPTDRGWLVTLEGRTMGRYPSRTEAVEAAIVMADLMGAMRHDADVMLQTGDGQPLELIWTYGVDALPNTVRPARRTIGGARWRQRVRRIQRAEAAA